MDILQFLVTIFTDYGYLAVFTVLLICGFGVPIPEDVSLVAGGVISGLGYAHVHTMFAVGMLGVLIGDSCMFLAGRHFGARLLQHRYFARMMTPERYAAVQDKFERYGNRVLFVARFLPGLRTPIYLTAGMSGRISYFRFLLLDGFAALISVPIWVYLGYYGASNHEWLIKWLGRGQSAIMVFVAIIAVIVAVWYFRHCRKPK
ncbi:MULTISPECIES: DedA family protein [Deefgea]|uniref:DedA family protein n=1 Tax=Deefgea piscis TaxID=2739061 RepID=A0A6M8SYM1_9NEIS|nr:MULTISPECIES: DedA family protein [Deefgea]MBM5574912.1 DedA family protein [Deefgea sp. CFH1-16]QKJ66887.1 DedA family protein [Deefgea piscis]